MLGFIHLQATTIAFILNRSKFLPFVLHEHSKQYIPEAIQTAKDSNRKLVILSSGAANATALSNYCNELNSMPFTLALFDSLPILESLQVKIVDAKKTRKGQYEVLQPEDFKPSILNNLFWRENTALDPIFLDKLKLIPSPVQEREEVTKYEKATFKTQMSSKLTKRKPLPAIESLSSLLDKLPDDKKEIFVKYFVGKLNDTEFEKAFGRQAAKWRKIARRYRPKLLKAYFFLRKQKDVSITVYCSKANIPFSDITLLLGWG